VRAAPSWHDVRVTSNPEWPPRTPAASGALLWAGERLLLLRPTYKPTWTLPGGCVEEGESPLAACLREVQEETGLRRTTGILRCVDYRTPGPGAGGLRFLFDLGVLGSGEERELRLPPDEIAEHRLVTAQHAEQLLDDAQGRRLAAVLAAPASVLYLEGGAPPVVA
jgi:8-oxo-dGTP diphosphatase